MYSSSDDVVWKSSRLSLWWIVDVWQGWWALKIVIGGENVRNRETGQRDKETPKGQFRRLQYFLFVLSRLEARHQLAARTLQWGVDCSIVWTN